MAKIGILLFLVKIAETVQKNEIYAKLNKFHTLSILCGSTLILNFRPCAQAWICLLCILRGHMSKCLYFNIFLPI